VVELIDTFIMESEVLDKDHKRLVEMVNTISECLDNGNTENCKADVLELVNFAKGHFSREEQLLTKVGYPDVGKHRKHHRELDHKMEHMLEFAEKAQVNEMACDSLKRELVYFVMDDVITTDMDFKAFIADKIG